MINPLQLSKTRFVKSARKEASLSRELIPAIEQAFLENKALEGIFVSRVALSKEGGCVAIFVSHRLSADLIDRAMLDLIKAFRPSIRVMVSKILESNWTPQVTIRLDEKIDKFRKTDELLNQIAMEAEQNNFKPIDQVISDLQNKILK